MSYQLIEAVSSGAIEKVVELLNKGAEVNASNTRSCTLFHFAAIEGYTEIASLLLKHGASVKAQDDAGETPLHSEAEWGHTKVAMVLREHRANINAGDSTGSAQLGADALGGDTFTTGERLARQLEAILKGEREAELKGIGKNIVRGMVETVSGDLATIHCTTPSSRRETFSRELEAAWQRALV